MNEEIIAIGKIFVLVQMPQDDGRVLEVARRTPGVRVIIHDEVNKKVLLTREFRRELGEYDYRLLGGKVFDTLDEFADFRASNADIMEAAKQQAIAEAQQEAGIEISQLDFYKKSKADSAFISRPAFFDKLAGTDVLRKQIIAGLDEKQIRQSWQNDLSKYKTIRKKYLMYAE